MVRKKILFITGTRADFGKLKPLLSKCSDSELFDVTIFVTGLHMLRKYGSTWEEVKNVKYGSIFTFINQNEFDQMDSILAKTITGLSDFVKETLPDLIVIHGDRTEALAGAIVGTFNNVRVAHIEGGEISGTLDEIIRHSISKMSHLHFVANNESQNRLVQMGEDINRIFVIGSPEVDIMTGDSLPKLNVVKSHYDITFDNYNIVIFHPVTFEFQSMKEQMSELVEFILKEPANFVIIYPNNDLGSKLILDEFPIFETKTNIRIIPSMRFEYYLTLLKNANSIIGNSSSGVREAPVYGIPSINIGTRQTNRSASSSILHCNADYDAIKKTFAKLNTLKIEKSYHFGSGNSAQSFYNVLTQDSTWKLPISKQFIDLGN